MKSGLVILKIGAKRKFNSDYVHLLLSFFPFARIIQLGKSCAELPTSLAFTNDKKKVTGHCRLCKVLGQKDCCYIESGKNS